MQIKCKSKVEDRSILFGNALKNNSLFLLRLARSSHRSTTYSFHTGYRSSVIGTNSLRAQFSLRDIFVVAFTLPINSEVT